MDEVKLFYNAFLLQFEHSHIKFLSLRGVQKAYGLLNAARKTKNGEIKAKDTEAERTSIKELERYLFKESEA